MSGGGGLAALPAALRPRTRPGEYVFVSVPRPDPGLAALAAASIREGEGVTLVLPRPDADAHGLAYGFVAAWITLEVHSALDAVGLTAAVAGALAARGIACNVLAGFHHDHLLVPAARREQALAALSALDGRAPA